MRNKVVFRPGAGGLITDIPSNLLKSDSYPYAKDVILHQGVARERWGFSTAWEPDWFGTSDSLSVARVKFKLADRTCWVVTTTAGEILTDSYDINLTSTDDKTISGRRYTGPLVRCVYRDEAIVCYRDGRTPIARYSGGARPSQGLAGAATYTQNQSNIEAVTGLSFDQDAAGFYVRTTLGIGQVHTEARVVDFDRNTLDDFTIEDAIHLGATSYARSWDTGTYASETSAVAWASFPCVSIESQGTVTVTASTGTYTVNSFGARWSDHLYDAGGGDFSVYPTDVNSAVLYWNTPTSTWKLREVNYFTLSFASLYGAGSATETTTKQKYEVLMPPTFTDAAVHKGSLWGCGVYWWPNRVYVAPPGWNPAYPPGATYPYDVSEELSKASPDMFKLDFVDVPTRDDSDAVVALLPSNGPLLVLKRSSVYAVHGSYPNFDVNLLSETSGCLTREGAVTIDNQPFWLDRNGIYTYRGGQVVDLTAGKISRQWRGLMAGWQGISTSKLAIGGVAGYLVVSLLNLDSTKTFYGRTDAEASNPTKRVLVYSLEAGEWVTELSGVNANCFGSIRAEGEADALVFGLRDTAPHYDLAPALTGAAWDWAAPVQGGDGTFSYPLGSPSQALNYDEDGVGTTPTAEFWTPSNLAERAGIDGEARLIDASAVTVNHDAGGTPRTQVLKVSQDLGRLGDKDATPVTVATINATSTKKFQRTRFRVGRSGRQHQVRVSLGNAPTTSADQEFHEFVLNFRDPRSRP